MATLSLSTFTCPTAELGPENPHAPLRLPYPVTAHYQGRDMPVEHCLPYRLQDGYTRELKPKDHKVTILESDTLKATFLLDLGGRLWSLIHKPTGRELLYVNPVIQFANFGIRNAWFSGGIEWNVGVFGHSVFTCSPVFAGRTRAPDGTDGLRIWEFERIRGVVWQVDFWAPDGSDFLYWMPRIVNPHDEEIPMYWWTCIAVPEIAEGRVLAPANRALEPAHAMGEESVWHDLGSNPDVTYPQRREMPKDTYFDIPDGERPWIAHLGPDREGLVHLSSPFLKGRKQWVWGMKHCGQRWQEWLSPGGPPYIEIQGGLAKKQSDYVAMPGLTSWSWLESFGPVSGVDALEWTEAIEGVAAQLIPQENLLSIESKLLASLSTPLIETMHSGSGWAAVERKLSSALPGEVPFPDDTITAQQSPWREALESRWPNQKDLSEPPGGYVSDNGWLHALDYLKEDAGSEQWLQALHKGVLCHSMGAPNASRGFWRESVELSPNPWALRNLAILDWIEGDLIRAYEKITEAFALLPGDRYIAIEACQILFEAGEFEMLERFLDDLPLHLKTEPRVKLAYAQIALQNHRTDEVKRYFQGTCDLADLRESETVLTDLWVGLCGVDPSAGDPQKLPPEWDFRMQ